MQDCSPKSMIGAKIICRRQCLLVRSTDRTTNLEDEDTNPDRKRHSGKANVVV
jgi:hypothetical protein